MSHLLRVSAEVEAYDGGSDGAYSLIVDRITVGEFLAELSSVLQQPIRDMLLRGGHTPCGHVLVIRIYDHQEGGE